MKERVQNNVDAEKVVEALRLDLEECRRELGECRLRLEQKEGLFAHVADAVFVAQPDGRIIEVNPAACAMLGYSKVELLTFHQWDIVTSASREEILKLWHSMKPGAPVTVQRTCRTKRGEQIVAELRLARGVLGGRDLIIVTCRDVTEQQTSRVAQERAEALLAGEKQLLEMVALGHPLPETLAALCLLIEGLSRGSQCGILLVNHATNRVEHGAGPSLPKSYNDAIHGIFIEPGAGPCGLAVCTREQVIAADIGSDARWAGLWRGVALSCGLQACWSTPIFASDGRVLGTFAVYWREPCSPTSEDRQLIEHTTHLAAVAIERKNKEDELRRGAAYLAEAQRLSRTGSFGWHVATGQLVWSAETFCIMGVDPMTRPTLELVLQRVHPDDLTLVQQTIDRATRDGRDFDFEHRLLMPDGVVKHVQVMARGVKPGSGGIEFGGAMIDITVRNQTKEAMRAAKARFEGILVIAEDAIISVNSDQRIALFNQGAEKTFGYTAAEVLGQSLDILLPQRFASAHRGHIEAFAKSPEVSRLMGQRREVFGRRKNGTEFPAEASISKLDLGTEVLFTVILRDITERKLAEEKLRRSEADLHEAHWLTHTCSWKHNLVTGKVKVSPEVYRIFAIQPGEDASDPRLYFGRIHPEDRPRIEELFAISEREKVPYQADYRIVLPDGAIRHQHAFGRPVLNEAGDLVEFVGTAIDMTEQRVVQEALHASEHLARGQVEALKSASDALATESDPDRLLEHILRTIAEQFGAHSVSVWRRDEASGRIGFETSFENGKLLRKTDARFVGTELWLPMDDLRPWTEVFRTGKASVIEDIRLGEPFPLRDRLLPLGIITILLVPMSVTGRLEGAIGIRFTQKRTFRAEEIELAQALANQAMLAMQLSTLHAQNRQTAVMEERNRMARDIHDTLAQGFTGVIMQLEAAKGATSQGDLAETANRIERASDLARSSLGEARRSVRALRPRSLRDGKLFMALDGLLKRMTEGTSLNAEFQAEGNEQSILGEFEEGLLRITQEALTNAVKHADARNFRATLSIDATKSNSGLWMMVAVSIRRRSTRASA